MVQVTDPAQARDVIGEGKMAVILGVEASKVLNCGEFLGAPECTREQIVERLDRLYAAKAYLQTDVATAEGEVMQEINNEIANEEVDAARLRHSARDTEKGQTHG